MLVIRLHTSAAPHDRFLALTDQIERLIHKQPNGALLVRGRAETRKLFRVVGLETKSEFVTVGGFVADLLGRVPQVGDIVEWENLRFEVTKATSRRAERITVTVLHPVMSSQAEEIA